MKRTRTTVRLIVHGFHGFEAREMLARVEVSHRDTVDASAYRLLEGHYITVYGKYYHPLHE